jgi:hypothetical protein
MIKDEDRQWIGELLHWPIELTLTHKEIAQAAYFIWMEQGCPDGRADEHWQLAVERLKHERENSERIGGLGRAKSADDPCG